MASIKGFQLKSVKNTIGMEGYGCLANMYLNGKKMGTYADYGDGAPEVVNYVSNDAEEAMTKVIIAYAKEHPNQDIIELYEKNPQLFQEECEKFKKHHPYIPNEDITVETMASNSVVYIVSDLLSLLEAEKVFKKYQKKGYKAISFDGTNWCAYPASWSDEKIKTDALNKTLYMSLEDFCI